jgi:hypothetical protein
MMRPFSRSVKIKIKISGEFFSKSPFPFLKDFLAPQLTLLPEEKVFWVWRAGFRKVERKKSGFTA